MPATSDPESPIARIPVPVDTRAPGGTTNAYVAGGLLVDPAARTDALDAAVAARGSSDAAAPAVEAIAVTHAHPDHVGAVADYAALTDATVVAREGHGDRFAAATGVAPDERIVPGGTRSMPDRKVRRPRGYPNVSCWAAPSRSGGGGSGS